MDHQLSPAHRLAIVGQITPSIRDRYGFIPGHETGKGQRVLAAMQDGVINYAGKA